MVNKRRIGVGIIFVLGLVAVLFIVGTGSVSATEVDMNFDSGYDGGQENNITGREIFIEGEIRVEEENAVDPRIRISSSEQTVMDQETFDVNVDPGLDVDDRVTEDGVLITAEEIPAGNSVNVEFVVYPRGTDEVEITSAEVRADFETPGGTSKDEYYEVTTTLSGGCQDIVQEQRDRIEELERELEAEDEGILPVPWQWIVGAIVAIFALLLIAAAIDSRRN